LSMHLVGPALTTTRTKKYKLKLTNAKRRQLECDLFEYNKKRKRNGEPKVTFDEYLDIRCGRVIKRKLHPSEQGQLDPNYLSLPPHRQTTKHIPSLNTGVGVATKKETQKYTGENLLGIGQLHKSNAIPVFKQSDAEDLAKMRRG